MSLRSDFYSVRSAILWIVLGAVLFPALLIAAFILSWTIDTALKQVVGEAAAAAIFGLLLGSLAGLGTSIGSGLVMGRMGIGFTRWLASSVLFSAAGFALMVTPLLLLNDQNELPDPVIGIVMGLALGLSIGTGQYVVLRGRIARAGRWVAVSAAAFLIGLGFGLPLGDGSEILGIAFIGLAPMGLTWLGMGQLWGAGEATAEDKSFRRLLWGGAALSLVILLIGALVVTNNQEAEMPPIPPSIDPQQHLIFHNGVLLTMDETLPQAQAMVIEGEIITAVGDDQEILALRQANSRVIDLDGRTLMPGFVDAHSHLFNDAESSFDMSIGEIQQVGLENGITTIGDLYVNSSFLREIQDFEDEGRLQIRTSLYLVATDPCGKSQGDWFLEHPPSDRDFEMLRINGIKIFTDGPGCDTRPALSYEIEAGDGLGDLFHSQEELDALVAGIHQEGYQLAIHAIGDRAVEQAQNAIANALDGKPNTPRHRIEHNSVVRPEQIRRYGEIGIVPVVFGLYPICNPFGPLPPEPYHSWEWPYRAMLDENPGLKLAWSGDDPFFGRVRPLDDFYSLVTRNDIDEEGQICLAPDWLRQHLVTREEALRMMTTDAAYSLFRDDEVGQLKPGLAADLLLLSDNPLTVETENLPQLEVWMTLIGGRVAHCAAGQERYCP